MIKKITSAETDETAEPEEVMISDDEEWDPTFEFADMLTTVTELLDHSANMKQLKKFLKFLCHPHTPKCYIDIRLYDHCNTPGEIIEALHPQYINFMHTHLLRRIVNKFGDEQSKMLLKQYEDKFPRKKPLKQMSDPLSDEEIKSFSGTMRMKVVYSDASIDTSTMEDVERVRQSIIRNTGVDGSVIPFASQKQCNSVLFTFLIPEIVISAFSDLDEDNRRDLADHGILRIEVDGLVIDMKSLQTETTTDTSQVETMNDALQAEAKPDTLQAEPKYITSQPKTNIFLAKAMGDTLQAETVTVKWETETKSDTSQTETKSDTSQTETKSNTKQTETKSCTSQAETKSDTSQTETKSDTSQTETKSDTSQTETKSDPSQMKTKSDTSQTETKSDPSQTETKFDTSPAETKSDTSPAETKSDTSQTETKSETSQMETKSDTSQMETKSDTSQMETKSDTSQTETKSDTSQTETKSDPSQMETKSDTSQTETKSDTSQTETKSETSQTETECDSLLEPGSKTYTSEAETKTDTSTYTTSGMKRVPLTQDSPKRTYYNLEFQQLISEVGTSLAGSVKTNELKEFLQGFSHILYPEAQYIDSRLLKDAESVPQIFTTLQPLVLNFVNWGVLWKVVDAFDITVEPALQSYASRFPSHTKLSTFPDPLSEEEISELKGYQKLRVTRGDGSRIECTLNDVQVVKEVVEKATGIDQDFIIYAYWERGFTTHQFTFLIPKSICGIFWELCEEDLTILAEKGVRSLEVDYDTVADNIQEHYRELPRGVTPNRTRTKNFGLEHFIPTDQAEQMSKEDFSHLNDLITSTPVGKFQEVCSNDFLKVFAKRMSSWKDLAPYLGINQRNLEDLAVMYPGDEEEQNYVALLNWKSIDVNSATYERLVECLLMHGHIDDAEKLLLHFQGQQQWFV